MLRTCSELLGGQERADINTLSIGTPMRSQGSLGVYIDAKFGPTCAAAGQASVGPPFLPTPLSGLVLAMALAASWWQRRMCLHLSNLGGELL